MSFFFFFCNDFVSQFVMMSSLGNCDAPCLEFEKIPEFLK